MKIIEFNQSTVNELNELIASKTQLEYGEIQKTVDNVLSEVKARGDEAVFEFTRKFDKFDVNKENFLVSKEEIEKAYTLVDKELTEVIRKSAQRIREFHEKQKLNSWLEPSESGELLGQLIRPLNRVGVYVPGGKAAYPSSVLMNVIPAKVAGVNEVVMTTPAGADGEVNPNTIVAADIAGADKIYKVGGAQAVAALAFGTESIERVDKIVGPGNIYVALAKKSVFGFVNIDSVAGPSEILIIADENARADFVAADMLSQAEHDEMASSILVTNSKELAYKVEAELEKQLAVLERKDIAKKSLENYGAIIITEDIDTAIEISNQIAPEHLEVCVNEPFNTLPAIKNAGAIFLGNYTPEPLGDYMAGPNHVLPTGGTARFFSPLSIDDYIKKSSVLSFSEKAMRALGEDVIKFAEAEGLTAHANSIKIRL